jgi:hypothetical protein
VPTYRLRYQSTDLEMPPGEFVVGRSSSCHLALDDALVSRRHAVFQVSDDALTVEDLGSRNGISVNGRKVEGAHPVGHMDRVTIGSQELLIVEVGRRIQGNRPTQEYALCEACSSPVDADASHCPSCGTALPDGRGLANATLEMKSPFAPTGAGGAPGTDGGTFHLIAGIAEKGLAMRRYDEAERMLAAPLEAMLERARKGIRVPDDQARQATRFALDLAGNLGRSRWIDWVFRLHEATHQLLTADTIDRLYELVRKTRYDDARPLRAYLAAVRGKAADMSAAERFLLKRLEGLERVISA